ncbi:MAG: hypothetical protein QOE29_1294 [Gaiellaceae bacterium]|jgi:hypothetical protein|nr:hypothetical protein [Gaiellaceae bacterium]
MAEVRVRLAIGVVGPRTLDVQVSSSGADELDRALAAGEPTVRLDTEDGPLTLVLAQVVYVQRSGRESHVGFGA